MQRLHWTVLAFLAFALAGALALASAAAADQRTDRGGARVVPVKRVLGLTGGELIGRGWATTYALPSGDATTCGRLLDGRVLLMGPAGGTITCTVTTRTKLVVIGYSSACSDAEPPPFYGADEAEQRACALAADEWLTSTRITVDGGRSVDIRRPRFEVYSPQITVDLPADNYYNLPAGTTTLTAHAWLAQVRKLRPGQHTITIELISGDDSIGVTTHIINVVRPRHDWGDVEEDADDMEAHHEHVAS